MKLYTEMIFMKLYTEMIFMKLYTEMIFMKLYTEMIFMKFSRKEINFHETKVKSNATFILDKKLQYEKTL